MPKPLRNRIKDHRLVRAGDLVPHPLNWRNHPQEQQQTLRDLYATIGFARSLLAYELPDGRLQLIDGHLRRDLTPDECVVVEVLDVTDEEARTLMLSLDPLAALATADASALAELRSITETDSAYLQKLWDGLIDTPTPEEESPFPPEPDVPEQYLILVTCADETEQLQLLAEFQEAGHICKPLTSY